MQDSPHLFTRRAVLRLGGALSLGLLPAVSRAEGSEPGAFRFVVANDLHFRDARCAAWLRALVAAMKAHEPDFCVLNGDLSENGTAEQLAAVRAIFADAGLRLFVSIGNHDHVTDSDRAPFEAIFPDSLNYHFAHKSWRFVTVDSTEGQRVFYTRIQPPALAWLDRTLPLLDKTQPLVLLTHFPLGSGVWCRPRNAPQVLERLRGQNLRAVFNGHWHGFTKREFAHAPVVTNRCCSWWRPNNDGTPEKGYFLCRAQNGEITREFCQIT